MKTVACMFREQAFQCANYLIHTSANLSHVRIIPPISEVSSNFKRKLKNSLDTGLYGWWIFHGNPESDDPVGSEGQCHVLCWVWRSHTLIFSCLGTLCSVILFKRHCSIRTTVAGLVFWRTPMAPMGPPGHHSYLPAAICQHMSAPG